MDSESGSAIRSRRHDLWWFCREVQEAQKKGQAWTSFYFTQEGCAYDRAGLEWWEG